MSSSRISRLTSSMTKRWLTTQRSSAMPARSETVLSLPRQVDGLYGLGSRRIGRDSSVQAPMHERQDREDLQRLFFGDAAEADLLDVSWQIAEVAEYAADHQGPPLCSLRSLSVSRRF